MLHVGGARKQGARLSGVQPALDLSFLGADLDPRISVVRASLESYWDSTGTRQDAAANVSPLDYDPVTLLVRGRPIWEGSTNANRNPRGEGITVGVPGVSATYWTVTAADADIQREIVGSGSEDGIPYNDIRYFGTPTVSTSKAIVFEGSTQIAALSGQTWTSSKNVRVVGGSLSNAVITASIFERSAAGGALASTQTPITPTTGALRSQRYEVTRTLNNASTAFVTGQIGIAYTVGNPIDVTLRIGGPQLEQKAFATPLILPPVGSPAQSTRLADVATSSAPAVLNGPAWTYVAEFFLPNINSSGQYRIWEADDGTNVARLRNSGSGTWLFEYGATSANGGAIVAGLNKIAVAVDASGVAISVNGAAVVTGAAPAAIIATFDRLTYGGSSLVSARQMNGHKRRDRIYPARLSDSQLRALSA